jgi:hypothetical protein
MSLVTVSIRQARNYSPMMKQAKDSPPSKTQLAIAAKLCFISENTFDRIIRSYIDRV